MQGTIINGLIGVHAVKENSIPLAWLVFKITHLTVVQIMDMSCGTCPRQCRSNSDPDMEGENIVLKICRKEHTKDEFLGTF